jgi:hypothetical protein
MNSKFYNRKYIIILIELWQESYRIAVKWKYCLCGVILSYLKYFSNETCIRRKKNYLSTLY